MADDWYDSKPIQTANFTHDWGSIGCNEMAFLNIALEWLCDHQHNGCYYSVGPSSPLSLYRVHCVITAELRVNLRLRFLAVSDVTILSTGSNSWSVNWAPQSLSRFMESQKGHRRFSEEAIQGARLASELQLGNFWPLEAHCWHTNSLCSCTNPKGYLYFIDKLSLNCSYGKII